MHRALDRYQEEIAQLCRTYHVHRLELFGSAATGDDRPETSDLDFLVQFEPLSSGSYADAYFGLLEALEALLGRRVDLIVSSAIRNPYFRASVNQSRVLVFAA